MGPKGWVGVRLDYKVKWDDVAGILKDGYLMSAPKRLGGRVPSAMDGAAATNGVAKKRRTPDKARKTASVRHHER
jgi:hypothetical protein